MTEEQENYVRVFYSYEDFKMRLDDNSPVHYDVQKRNIADQKWALFLRIYGTDRRGRLIIYETKRRPTYQDISRRSQEDSWIQNKIDEFVQEFAAPLNAVLGRIEAK